MDKVIWFYEKFKIKKTNSGIEEISNESIIYFDQKISLADQGQVLTHHFRNRILKKSKRLSVRVNRSLYLQIPDEVGKWQSIGAR